MYGCSASRLSAERSRECLDVACLLADVLNEGGDPSHVYEGLDAVLAQVRELAVDF